MPKCYEMNLSAEKRLLLASLIRQHPPLYDKWLPENKDADFKQKLFCEVTKEFCLRTGRMFSNKKVLFLKRQWRLMRKNYKICLREGKVLGFDYLSHCSFLTEPSKLQEKGRHLKQKDQNKSKRQTRTCCACGSPKQRFLMILLSASQKKRIAWLTALGVPQEKIESIDAKHSRANPSYLCIAHFPAEAFVYRKRRRLLADAMPLKLEDTRSNGEVKSRHREMVNSVSQDRQVNSNINVTINNVQKEEGNQGNQLKLSLEQDESNLAMNITERQKRTLEEEFLEGDLEPLKRRHRSGSPEREDSQMSLLLGSRSWLDLVNALHPSTDKMNADELNEHQTMMSILTSNNIDPENNNSSGNETTLCISSLDLLHEGTELLDLFHHNAYENNSFYAHYSRLNKCGTCASAIDDSKQDEKRKQLSPAFFSHYPHNQEFLSMKYEIPYCDRPLHLYALWAYQPQVSDMCYPKDPPQWPVLDHEISVKEAVALYSDPPPNLHGTSSATRCEQDIATDPCYYSDEALVSDTELTAQQDMPSECFDPPPQPKTELDRPQERYQEEVAPADLDKEEEADRSVAPPLLSNEETVALLQKIPLKLFRVDQLTYSVTCSLSTASTVPASRSVSELGSHLQKPDQAV